MRVFRINHARIVSPLLILAAGACGKTPTSLINRQARSAFDAGMPGDAVVRDQGPAPGLDSGPGVDVPLFDGGLRDQGFQDGGPFPRDFGTPDQGTPDFGTPDAGINACIYGPEDLELVAFTGNTISWNNQSVSVNQITPEGNGSVIVELAGPQNEILRIRYTGPTIFQNLIPGRFYTGIVRSNRRGVILLLLEEDGPLGVFVWSGEVDPLPMITAAGQYFDSDCDPTNLRGCGPLITQRYEFDGLGPNPVIVEPGTEVFTMGFRMGNGRSFRYPGRPGCRGEPDEWYEGYISQ